MPVDLKAIYNASSSDEAELRLMEFEEKWSGKYPSIAPIWRRNWEHVIPFFAYPAEIRKAHLYDQYHRITEYVAEKSDEEPGSIPK